jgi:hypothetical protein
MKMEPIEGSKTSAFKTQTLGKYPKENILHKEHGKSLKSRYICSLSHHTKLYLTQNHSRVSLILAFLCSTTTFPILHSTLQYAAKALPGHMCTPCTHAYDSNSNIYCTILFIRILQICLCGSFTLHMHHQISTSTSCLHHS